MDQEKNQFEFEETVDAWAGDYDRKHRMKDGLLSLLTVLLVVVLCMSVIFVPSLFFINEPGGTAECSGLVYVDEAYPAEGSVSVVAVSTRSGDLFQLIGAMFDPYAHITRRTDMIPEGWTMEEYNEYLVDLLNESQLTAQYAAFTTLGYEVEITHTGVSIMRISEGSKAEGILQPDDEVLAVDGIDIKTASEISDIIAGKEPGDTLLMKILRGEEELEVTVELMKNEETGKAALGVYSSTTDFEMDFPVDVVFDMGSYGGPSGGAAMTLEIMNQLTDADIFKGHDIAVTGTVDLDGNVGEIGEVDLKVKTADDSGIDLFFCPTANGELAQKAGDDLDVTVVPVDTIQDILDYLGTLEPKAA